MSDMPEPEQKSFAEKLKPVPKWVTTGAKITSGLAIAGGTILTTVGVMYAFSPVGKKHNNPEDITGKIIGLINIGEGLIYLTGGMLGWKAASGASRAREFVEHEKTKQNFVALAEQLQEQGHSR